MQNVFAHYTTSEGFLPDWVAENVSFGKVTDLEIREFRNNGIIVMNRVQTEERRRFLNR